jgi:eukaryotic-like serine/threonine-protein kinase
MELFKGALIAGRYLVEDKVGEGSFGAVWSGKHTGLGAKVALKTLLPAAAADEESVTRFRREARFLARIRSDHVARVLDFIHDPTFGLVLVMEFVEGDLLFDAIRGQRMSVEESIAVGIDVLQGLCDLHAAHVIHRDLKPGNVILRPMRSGRRRAIIFDFSLSRTSADGPKDEDSAVTNLTQSGVALGTLPYMAPEQILNSREVTERSDLYSLGAVLYRMVAGKHLFSETSGELMRTKLTRQPPRLDTGRADPVAHGFEEIVLKAVQRKPVDRFATAEQMLAQMTALEQQARSADEPPPTQTVVSIVDLDADGAAEAPTGRMERGVDTSSNAPPPPLSRDPPPAAVVRPVHVAAAFAILCIGMACGSAWTRHRLAHAIAEASASGAAARRASPDPAPAHAGEPAAVATGSTFEVPDDAAVAEAQRSASAAPSSPTATAAVAHRAAPSTTAPATTVPTTTAPTTAPPTTAPPTTAPANGTTASAPTPTSLRTTADAAGVAAPGHSLRSVGTPNGTDNPQ